MKEAFFEQQLMHGVYMLGRQRDAMTVERKRLVRQVRYNSHSARLEQLIKHYEFGAIIFACLGAIMMIMMWGRSVTDEWWLNLIAMGSMLTSFGIIRLRNKIVSRKQCFDERYQAKHLNDI